MSMKFEIVMFNMSSYSEWQRGVANRNYHIFRKLLESGTAGRIICVDFLPFTFKRALRNYWENIIKKPRINPPVGGQKSKITNIYRDLTTKCVKVDSQDVELYVFSTIDSIFSHQRVVEKLNKVLSKISQSPNRPIVQMPRIIWSCFPMFVEYFECQENVSRHSFRPRFKKTDTPIGLKADLTIFDAVDNWLEHPSFVKHKALLESNYRLIVQKSDLIFTVSESLIVFFRDLGREKDIYWLSNGVDMEHFAENRPLIVKDKLFEKIPRPIAGYIGIIQDRVDVDLLEYLAQNNPKKSFVLIGPLWPVFFRRLRRPAIGIKKLKKYKNIYLLGRKSWEDTPFYVRKFDVGISPHKLNEFAKYTNSLKILEYLACGLPAVTTPSSGVERFSHLVYLAQNYRDFSEKIDLALKNDTIELKNQRIARASQEDWNLKIKEMMKCIIEKIKTKK